VTTVRPFTRADVPEVGSLVERLSGAAESRTDARLSELFLDQPWASDEIPSYVYENAEGRVSAFLGVHVRRVLLDDRQLRMAACARLAATAAALEAGAAESLLAAVFTGPQDLTVADMREAHPDFRSLGGETVYLSCVEWIRVLRPASAAAAHLRGDRGLGRLRGSTLRAVDTAVGKLPGAPGRPMRPAAVAEELTPQALQEHLPELTRGFTLRPDYDRAYLDWLFGELEATDRRASLLRRLVRAEDGRAIGAYVAKVAPGAATDVLLLVGAPKQFELVVDQLFTDAYEAGASTVRGRLEPRIVPALWERQCVLRRGATLVVHSSVAGLTRHVHSGRALLPRLDGDGWLEPTNGLSPSEPVRRVAARPPGLQVELTTDLDPLREDWSRLSEESGNVFSTWEWNALWWRQFGRGRQPVVAVVRPSGGEVSAIVPLYRWASWPLTVLRLMGHGHGDLLGPICAPGQGRADALSAALAAVRFDVFIGDLMPADQGRASIAAAQVLQRTGYPILHFRGATWDEYLATRSHGFRKQVRGFPRRLQARYEVNFRLCTERADLDRDLDILFGLHRARFDEHERCLFCGSSEPFQRAFAAAAFERGWLRLWLLEVDGVPVAADYGFRFAGAEFGYQAGRDPEWDDRSVGFVLQTHVIGQACADGVSEYRFLEGPESYKYRYTEDDPGLVTIALAGSAPGRVVLGGAQTLRRLPPAVALWRRRAH
jgi:CelD/BcsL family acetyltransferase involved in cellulose biosynthesis